MLDKIYKMNDAYDKYNRSSVRFEQNQAEIDSIPLKEKQLKAYTEEFVNAKEAASKMAADEDEDIKPAEYVKNALTQAFNNLVAGSKLARAGYEARGDVEDTFMTVVDYSKEQKDMSELGIKLERMILTQKVAEEKERSMLANNPVGEASIHNSTMRESTSRHSIIKMSKVECPKFTGYPRDYAQFKKEFEAVVAVPGRQDNEIGVQLRGAVPRKFVHLVNNFELADWEGMLEALTAEFGASYLVVDDVVAQIERMKPVVNDKTILEFVEKLEMIQRD